MLSTRKIIACIGIAVVLASCQSNKQASYDTPKKAMPYIAIPAVKTELPAYTITEDMELGDKKTYAKGLVKLITGTWIFDNALIGSTDVDAKNGERSVRIAKGNLQMAFDINGVHTISVKHGKYGTGPNANWSLHYSTDSGFTYKLLATVSDTSRLLTTDQFAVSTTGPVRFKIVKKGTGRINIDDITFSGRGDPNIIIGEAEKNSADSGVVITSSIERGVTIGPDAPPASGDDSNILLGNPSGAQPVMAIMDNYLMDMGYYVSSYNATKAGPNWVSWHIDADNINNTVDRRNNFAGFNGLPDEWYTVKSDSYQFNKYGFDRGHNCPSADRTSSANANASTFLMINMIPQAPQNNQHTWNNFEAYLRSLVLQGNEIYIIMGNYGTGGTGSKGTFNALIDDGHIINVPKNIWKIAVVLPNGDSDIKRVTNSTRVIAINTPNDNSISKNWKKYITTVHDIESATGYNLLSNIPQSIQDVVENRKADIR